MASQVKPWDSHSDRWKRQKLREGLNPKKWDAWRKLAPASRRTTNPTAYAKGSTVREQRREPLVRAAIDRALAWATPSSSKPVNEALIRRNMNRASNKALKRYANMTDMQINTLDKRAQRGRKRGGSASPFWYHA